MRLINFRKIRYTAMIAFIASTLIKVSGTIDVPGNTNLIFLGVALIAGLGELMYG